MKPFKYLHAVCYSDLHLHHSRKNLLVRSRVDQKNYVNCWNASRNSFLHVIWIDITGQKYWLVPILHTLYFHTCIKIITILRFINHEVLGLNFSFSLLFWLRKITDGAHLTNLSDLLNFIYIVCEVIVQKMIFGLVHRTTDQGCNCNRYKSTYYAKLCNVNFVNIYLVLTKSCPDKHLAEHFTYYRVRHCYCHPHTKLLSQPIMRLQRRVMWLWNGNFAGFSEIFF